MGSFNIRVVAGCIVLVALPQSALAADYPAADYPDGMRGSYDWSDPTEHEDDVGFEVGLRYVYSLGSHTYSVGNQTGTSDDTSHILEGHLRIDDYTTDTFLRGTGGYAIAINGSYDNGYGTISDGTIAYSVFDLGQYWVGGKDEDYGLGGFVGYQYIGDNPDIGRANFTTATSADDVTWSTTEPYWAVPYDSEPNSVDIHALRLGLTATADLGDIADVSLDLAAIPYANISGTLGAFGTPTTSYNGVTRIQSSATTLEGWGYGAEAQLMFGLKPVENVAIRFGGRAQYLEGTYDATHSIASITDQADSSVPRTASTTPRRYSPIRTSSGRTTRSRCGASVRWWKRACRSRRGPLSPKAKLRVARRSAARSCACSAWHGELSLGSENWLTGLARDRPASHRTRSIKPDCRRHPGQSRDGAIGIGAGRGGRR